MVSQSIRILVFAALTLCLGSSQAAKSPLRIGTCVWPGYEPFYLARSLGALHESRVKLVQFRSSTQTMNALRTGAVECAALTLDEAVTLSSEGIALTVVQVLDTSYGADVIIAQPGIRSMSALAGHRVGVEGGAMGAYFLLRALEKSEMELDSVTLVRMEPRAQIEAFREKTVAAVVCFEPVRELLRTEGGTELFSSKQIPGEIIDVVVVRTDSLDPFRAEAAYLMAAWERALAYRDSMPDEAYAILGRRMGLDAEGAKRSYEGLYLMDCEENTRQLATDGPVALVMKRLQAFMLEQDLILSAALPQLAIGAVCPGGDL